MIAVRTTWLVKPNCMTQLVALLKASQVDLGNHVVRIYTPKDGQNVLVFEMTSESIQEHEQWWAALNARPGAGAGFAKWAELVEQRVSDDVWEVIESR